MHFGTLSTCSKLLECPITLIPLPETGIHSSSRSATRCERSALDVE